MNNDHSSKSTLRSSSAENQFKEAFRTALRNLKPGGPSIRLLTFARTFGLDRTAALKIIYEVFQDKTSDPKAFARSGGFGWTDFGGESQNLEDRDCAIWLHPSIKRERGFIQIRRGLREHLPGMSSNAVKLYLWLHFEVRWKGEKRGWIERRYSDIAKEIQWSQPTVERTMAELKEHYVEVIAARNQYEPTRIRIINYDGHENPLADATKGKSAGITSDATKAVAAIKSDGTKSESAAIKSDGTKNELASRVMAPTIKSDGTKRSGALKNQNLHAPNTVEEGTTTEEELVVEVVGKQKHLSNTPHAQPSDEKHIRFDPKFLINYIRYSFAHEVKMQQRDIERGNQEMQEAAPPGFVPRLKEVPRVPPFSVSEKHFPKWAVFAQELSDQLNADDLIATWFSLGELDSGVVELGIEFAVEDWVRHSNFKGMRSPAAVFISQSDSVIAFVIRWIKSHKDELEDRAAVEEIRRESLERAAKQAAENELSRVPQASRIPAEQVPIEHHSECASRRGGNCDCVAGH